MFGRNKREPDAASLLQPGELVTVRSYSGARADTEPRAIVVGGHELVIDEICWRAVVESGGVRSHAYVVRVGSVRARLRQDDANGSWEIERILPSETPPL